MMDTRDHTDGCDECALRTVERRAFLRDAVAQILAGIAVLSAVSAKASALPIMFIEGTGERTDKAYPIPAADGVSIDKDESVIIARVDNRAYAFSLACPHQNTAIRWDGSEHRFQCPKHKSRYRP